jgi:protein-tyrosine phosphatase
LRRVSHWFRTYGFEQILDGLLIGAYPLDEGDVEALRAAGVERILNLVEEREYRPEERAEVVRALAAAGIEEQRLGLVDYGGLPPEALDRAVQIVCSWLDEGACSYVHCRAGWQRSAAVAAAVVAIREDVYFDAALELVHERKSTADPLPHQREDVRRWLTARRDG